MRGMKLCCFVLVLWMCTRIADGQQRCLFSRLERLECPFRPALPTVGINQYGIFRSRISTGSSGFLQCRLRGRNVVVRNITTLGANEVRLLYSPGFQLVPRENYANQMLQIFNVRCNDGELVYFNITRQNIQPRDCGDPPVCADYVQVIRGGFGVTESCGNETGDNGRQLEGQAITVLFRTSELSEFPGFEMNVVCYRPEERDLPGCTRVEGDNATSSEDDTVSGTSGRKRRDLEEFHNQWHRRLRRRAAGLRFQRINVAFGDEVTYRNKEITVLRNNATIAFFRGVLILHTFDRDGRLDNYIREARNEEEQFILFRGPGPMVIIGRHAYFQLFAFDPRGIVPTPAEEEVVMELTQSQFDQLTPADDVEVVDPELPTDEIPASLINFGRKKRQTTITDDDSRTFDATAVRTAIVNENACNPVLRASARSVLTVNTRIDAARVNQIRQELLMATTQPPTMPETTPSPETDPPTTTPPPTTPPPTTPPPTTPPPTTPPPTTPLTQNASLNCSVRTVANNGTLDCDLMGEGVTTTDCFIDDMPLTCDEFPVTFSLDQLSQGSHNITVQTNIEDFFVTVSFMVLIPM